MKAMLARKQLLAALVITRTVNCAAVGIVRGVSPIWRDPLWSLRCITISAAPQFTIRVRTDSHCNCLRLKIY